MSAASSRIPGPPTVADVAFPDGRDGLFGVRATSTVHAALVAFALSGMSLHEEPVPVLAAPAEPRGGAEPGVPTVGDVVGSVRVARLRGLESTAAGDPVAGHMGPIPVALPADAPAPGALRDLGDDEIGLVVRGTEVVGVVTRRALVAAVRSGAVGDDGAGVTKAPRSAAVD